jgi:hypothetical protein
VPGAGKSPNDYSPGLLTSIAEDREAECEVEEQDETGGARSSAQHAQRPERRTGRLHRQLEPELAFCAFCNVSLESMRNLTSPPPLNIERPQSRLGTLRMLGRSVNCWVRRQH